MSVLVKNMAMPSSCTECDFVVKDEIVERIDKNSLKVIYLYNCKYRPDRIEDGWIKYSDADKKRQRWCPLEEINDECIY